MGAKRKLSIFATILLPLALAKGIEWQLDIPSFHTNSSIEKCGNMKRNRKCKAALHFSCLFPFPKRIASIQFLFAYFTQSNLNRLRLKASLVFYVLFLGALLFFSVKASLGDFANYYFGSWLLQQGQFSTAVFDVAAFNTLIYRVHPGLFLNHATLPPLSAVVFWPFSYLAPTVAKILFNLISCAVFGAALIRLAKHFSLQPLLFVALLAMPILSNLQQGQVYLLLFAFLSEGYLALEKGKLKTTALLWSFAIVLKLFPAILLLFLLAEKHYKALALTLVGCLFWVAITLPFVPFDTWMVFVFEHVPRLLQGEINNPFSSTYQTFGVWLNQVLVHNDIFNPTPWRDWPVLAAILKFAIQLKLLFLLVLGARKLKSSFEKFAFYVFVGFFISGYGSTYALVFLGFPLLAFSHSFNRLTVVLFTSSLFLAISIPLHYYLHLGLFLGFWRLWLILTAIVLIAFQLQFEISTKSYVLFLGLLLIFSSLYFIKGYNETHYITTNKSAILITDFKIENQQLKSTSFDEKGFTQNSTAFPFSSITTDAYLPNYNGPLYLVDDAYYVLLSDEQRGIGFTAIRKIYKQNVGEY